MGDLGGHLEKHSFPLGRRGPVEFIRKGIGNLHTQYKGIAEDILFINDH